MWSSGPRNAGGLPPRNQNPTQQGQGDDIFSGGSRLPSAQGSFRFSSQATAGATPSQTQSGEDFPPLNRNANGDIGQERGTNLISGLGYGSQASGGSSPLPTRSGNGLLNALSANSRTTTEARPSQSGKENLARLIVASSNLSQAREFRT